MTDWIPLLQTLVWPIFLAIIIINFRKSFEQLLQSVKKRIEEGSSLDVGPSGFTLGSAPQLPDDPIPEEMIDDGDESESTPELMTKKKAFVEELKTNPAQSLQLIHSSRFLKVKNERDYYRIVISLDPYNTVALSQVEKVVYFLHKTFKNPVREVTNRNTNFELRTAAWGEFTVRAEVFLKDQSEPLRLSRYLNIQARNT